MASGTITYQPNSQYTVFDDATGSVSYAYRTYFRNSVLAVTSLESDWITPAGFDFYSLGAIRQRGKDRLWDASYVKDDSVFDGWINEYQERLNNAAISVNQDYRLGTVDVGFDGTDGFGTIISADFKDIRRMWITYNGSDYFQATKMNINDFLPDQQFSSVHPYFAMRGDTIFQVRPDESGGTARITYYALPSVLDDDTDLLPVSMRGYTKGFVDYIEGRALLKDGKIVEGQTKINDAETEIERFKQEMGDRLKTGPKFIDITESIQEDDFLW